MNSETAEVLKMLKEFLKKATGDKATPEEIALIPQIAEILLKNY